MHISALPKAIVRLRLASNLPESRRVTLTFNTMSSNVELIIFSILGSGLLMAGHWFAVVRARFFASH